MHWSRTTFCLSFEADNVAYRGDLPRVRVLVRLLVEIETGNGYHRFRGGGGFKSKPRKRLSLRRGYEL
jgi:hypothetical protein